jgi:hypothetical protein
MLCRVFTLSIALLISATHALAAERYELSMLDAAEQVLFHKCKLRDFDTLACRGVVGKVCGAEENQDTWTCLRRDFERCKRIDFEDAACQRSLGKICDKSGDQWDRACDVYRYRTCLEQDLQGEVAIGRQRKSCEEVRLDLTLPLVEKAVQGIERSDAARPQNWRQGLCALAGGDTTSDLHQGYCAGGQAPAPCTVDPRHPALPFPDFLEAYEAMKDAGETSPACALMLFDQVLRGSGGGSGRVDTGNPWHALAALSVYLDHAEDADEAVRGGATRVLARFADDSFLPSFFLVVAAQDAAGGVRAAAMEGLAARHYESGLALLTLARGLDDGEAAVRAAAYAGLADRWSSDARGGYQRAIGRELTGLFPCGEALSAAELAAFRVRNPEDVRLLEPDRFFCLFGVGLELEPLRAHYLRRFEAAAAAALTKAERLAAIRGLPALAANVDKSRLKNELLTLEASESDVDLRVSALIALKRFGRDEEVGRRIEALAESLLLEVSPPREKEAFVLLRQLHGYLGPTRPSIVAGMPHEPGTPLRVLELCVEKDSLTLALRTRCFMLGAELVSGSFGDYNLETAFKPLLEQQLRSAVFGERRAALDALAPGKFRFQRDKATASESDRRQLARLLCDEASDILEERLDGRAPLLDDYVRACGNVHADTGAELERRLVSDSALGDWIEATLARNAPTLDVAGWYARYQRTHEDVVEKMPIEVTLPEGVIRMSGYRLRDKLRGLPPSLPELHTGDAIMLAYTGCLEEAPGRCKKKPDGRVDTWTTARRGVKDVLVAELPELQSYLLDILRKQNETPDADPAMLFWGIVKPEPLPDGDAHDDDD